MSMFGAMCTVTWTQIAQALRADGIPVPDKCGEKTRAVISEIVHEIVDGCGPRQGAWLPKKDVDRLTRAIDVALNGEDGAAKSPLLCDIASQVEQVARERGRPVLAGINIVEVEDLPAHVAFTVWKPGPGQNIIYGYMTHDGVWHPIDGVWQKYNHWMKSREDRK